jgi:hypothetical protein
MAALAREQNTDERKSSVSMTSPEPTPRANTHQRSSCLPRTAAHSIDEALRALKGWCVFVSVLAVWACGTTESQQPVCYSQQDCIAGLECRLGRCSKPVENVPGADAGAVPDAGQVPDAGEATCAGTGSCLLGEKCTAARDCKSQFCNSGVCCNERCSGDCAACNLEGTVGTCKPKPKGTACGAYVCDGVRSVCPRQCSTASECGSAYTCCTAATNEGTSDCAGRGLVNTCFQLPSCSSIQEDFEQATIDSAKWHDYTAYVNYPSWLSAGKLHVGLGLRRFGANAYSGLSLKQRVSLVGSNCQVEMAEFSAINMNSSYALAGLVIKGADGVFNETLRILNGTRLEAGEVIKGQALTPTRSDSLVPAEMRFLRIAEDAGVVSFAYSANGNEFTEFHSLKSEQRLSDVTLELSVFEADVQRDAGGSVIFDNVNIRPSR